MNASHIGKEKHRDSDLNIILKIHIYIYTSITPASSSHWTLKMWSRRGGSCAVCIYVRGGSVISLLNLTFRARLGVLGQNHLAPRAITNFLRESIAQLQGLLYSVYA